jgi:hypothetical protein
MQFVHDVAPEPDVVPLAHITQVLDVVAPGKVE